VPLPEEFTARQSALLGSEAPAFLASFDEAPVRALRVNERKATLTEITRRLEIPLDPVPWCPAATYLPADVRLGDTVEHRAGLFYLQEPSSVVVVEALDIEADHRVLDIAAAPGGKSTHTASRLGEDGFLLVNEVVSTRLGPLLANVDAWGYRNTGVASAPVPRLAAAVAGMFDRVIVDAPCSGEALFRRDPASREQWSEAQVRGAARRQGKLLASSAQAAAPGGLLAYTTCTFDPAENEDQVGRFLREHPEWELVDLAPLPGATASRVGGGTALRFYPHRCRCEGQFVAVLRAPGVRGTAKRRRPSTPPAHPAWAAFVRQVLREQPDPARVRLRGETFYLTPPGFDLPAAAAMRPGMPLGRLFGSTFRPAHAFAMSLTGAEVTASEAVVGDDLAALRRGEPFVRPGPPGWVLLLVQRWPIGWGQRKGDTIVPRLPGHASGQAASRVPARSGSDLL
jgi:16S rRNA C967 or C1407 C5-methylase (RsmB/RsmF family)